VSNKRSKKPKLKSRNRTRSVRTRSKPATKRPARTKTVPSQACPFCRGPVHQGDSEESFASLASLDPEAAVFYDRDLADVNIIGGLCGPRFRQNSIGLHAHYGNPAGAGYVVYKWQADQKLWKKIIDSIDSDRDSS